MAPSTTVDLLKKSLSSKVGWLTRTIKSCDDILKDVPLDTDSLTNQLKIFTERWSSYLTTQQKYEDAVIEAKDEALLGALTNEHDQWVDRYYSKCRECELKIKSQTNAGGNTSSSVDIRVKLPKVELPEFDGDITQWKGFKEKFGSLVGDRTDLSNINKLVYLFGQLKGEAYKLVSELKLESDNYNVAIQILDKNYSDVDLTKHVLIGKLLELENPGKHELDSLQQFRISLSCILGSLKVVQNLDGAEWLLQDIIQRKLPAKTIESLHIMYNKNYFSLKEIEDGLMDVCKYLQTTKRDASQGGAKPKSNQPSKKNAQGNQVKSTPKNQPSSSKPNQFWKEKDMIGTYVIQTDSDHSPTPSSNPTNNEKLVISRTSRSCAFCRGEHGSTSCRKYPDITSRKKRLQDLGSCLLCTGTNHTTTDCKTRLRPCHVCRVDKHHSALCPKLSDSSVSVKPKPSEQEDKPVVAKMSLTKNQQINQTTIFRPAAIPMAETTLRRHVKDPGTKVITMFDSAAQLSFISKPLADALGLKSVGKARISVEGFLSKNEGQEYNVVKPLVCLGRYKCKMSAVVHDEKETTIHTGGYYEATRLLRSKEVNMAPLTVNSDAIGPVGLIIGADYYARFIKRTVKRHGISLVTSSGGEMIIGPLPVAEDSNASVNTVFVTPQHSVMVARIGAEIIPDRVDELIEEDNIPIKKLWDLETIGIDEFKPSPEEVECARIFQEEVTYDNGQYWVGLPWKLNPPMIQSGYAGVKGQLKALQRRLGDKGDMLQMYSKMIQEQERSGFIERVTTPNYSEGHYLPHHAVWRESKTTPMRIVFNCSYRPNKDAPSLNDCLYVGPSLSEKLADIMIGFRQSNFAYSADISKAFLRIGLLEKDRNYTKFLWFEDPTQIDSPIITYRFKSVLFGSCASPFLLCGTLQHHFEKVGLRQMAKTFYMDNLQGAVKTTDGLKQIYQVANRECAATNLPLQSWNSNSDELNRIITKDYPDYVRPTTQKILGLLWDTEDDCLSLNPPLYDQSILTKRTLLSLVSKLFDPLGLISPLTIRGKTLIQTAWAEKMDWDAPLNESYIKDWYDLRREFAQVGPIRVPRQFDKGGGEAKLHIFCDASKRAYGAVAYYVNDDCCSLIMSKARVAPIKPRTLPQMELTAIELGVKLAAYLDKQIKGIQQIHIWTDSEICLFWIARQNCTMPYVQNRVETIKTLSGPNWKYLHVPSAENPADLLSRGVSLTQFKNDPKWFQGPSWIANVKEWPQQKPYCEQPEDPVVVETVKVTTQVALIEVERFSRLEKLQNSLGIVNKFLNTTKNLFSQVIKDEQKKYLDHIYHDINSKSNKLKITKDLGLFINEQGLISCRGRITKADIALSTKHPILLPKASHLTRLIVEQSHRICLHAGVGDTLAHVRQQYWLPQGRQVVRSLLRKCVHCNKYDKGPIPYPGPPSLPADRVLVEGRPFEVTGVDYTGAIQISGDGTEKKYYICLFTCAKVRAIHLELVGDLSSVSFINAFRRFAARRSCPRKLISDNGSNFVGAEPILREIFDAPEVRNMLKVRNCSWHFIAPRAPWQNGFTERLVGVVKKSLRKVLHKAKLNYDELSTILVEIESRVNNRPITYLDDTNVGVEPLTPSHLLYGHRIDTIPQADLQQQQEDPLVGLGVTRQLLLASYNRLNSRLKAWDKHWQEDYLLSLRERYHNISSPNTAQINIGDIVLLKEDKPRSTWAMGKIVEVYPDPEGVIRSVKVKTSEMESYRTINRLVPLELSVPPTSSATQSADRELVTARSRPMRTAARDSQAHWRQLLSQGTIT